MTQPRRTGMLVVSTTPPSAEIAGLIGELASADTVVKWGVRWNPGGGRHQVGSEYTHRLRTRLPGRGLRTLAVASAGALAPAPHALVVAVKFDPWFQKAVRGSHTIIATDRAAERAFRIAKEFVPEIGCVPHDRAREVLLQELAKSRLRAAVAGATDVEATARQTQWPQGVTAKLLRQLSDELFPADRFVELLSLLTAAQAADPNLIDDPALKGYFVASELSHRGATTADVREVTAAIMREADRAFDAGSEDVSTLVALAFDVLLHRELHSDGLASPLVDDPDSYLAVIRDSRVGRLVTDPGPRPARGYPQPGERRARLRVRVTPGPFSTFYRPIADALGETPKVDVEVLDLRQRRFGLANLRMHARFIQARLEHAREEPVTGHTEVKGMLTGADVLFVDWADKAAVLATIFAPPETRIIVCLHSVDLLRPWLHLVDWGRVDGIICVSPVMAEFAADLLGARIADIPMHVLPPPADPALLARPKTHDAPRTLGMVGWAQRVKDPLWALEVLARLAPEDERWHLRLIGADFPERQTSSGQAYAEAFRKRAMSDDVREKITYIGYTTDIPSHLREVGFILSTSRRESYHRAAVEGSLSGAIPVIRDWPMLAERGGAATVFPADMIVSTPQEAAERILAFSDRSRWAQESTRTQEALADYADVEAVNTEYRAIIIGEAARLADHLANEDDDAARQLMGTIMARPTASVHTLQQVARVAGRLGEMTTQLAALERLGEIKPDDQTPLTIRHLEGRINETEPGWWPTAGHDYEELTGEPAPGRVLHVLKVSPPDRTSGYTVRGWNTLNAQRDAGIDAVGVTALDFPTPQNTDADPEDVDGVPHFRLLRGAAPEDEPSDEYLNAWATHLTALTADQRPQILHVHSGHRGYESALVTLTTGRLLGIPVVYEVRGFFESLWTGTPGRAETGETYRRRRETETRCMREAAAVITLSESMRQEIIDRGIDPEKVTVVPNAVDAENFVVKERSPELVRAHDLEDQFVFGYVSNLDHPREGQEMLIRAAKRLREQGIRAKALIVGDGHRRRELETLVQTIGAQDGVVFTGNVPHDRVQEYYRLCDVFVIPRVKERAARLVTPLKPYEAMALGVPLLVSNLEALEEVIGHGERGTSFEAEDLDSLVDALSWARENPQALAAKAAEARTWVRAERTWEENARLYKKVYETIGLLGK